MASDLKSEIESANRKFESFFAANDMTNVGKCYSEDCVMMPPGGPASTGRASVAEIFGGAYKSGITGLKLTTIEVGGATDNPWERGSYVMSMTDGTVAEAGKFVVIWKRVDGKLHLHIDVWNSDA